MTGQSNETFNMVSLLLDRHLTSDEARRRPAVYFGSRVLTYADIGKAVARCGHALRQLGVGWEDRVVILLPDCPEALVSYLAAMKIGAVPVPVNTMAMPYEISYFLNDSRAKVLVVSDDLLAKVEEIEGQLQFLLAILVVGRHDARPVAHLGRIPRYSYHEFTTGQPEELETAPTRGDDMSYWQYSGGTTGRPKAIVHLHHDHTICTPLYCDQVLKITEKDITFSVAKFFFSYGLNNSLYVPFLYGAATVLYPDKPDPEIVLELIERYRVTILFSVATWYRAALEVLDQGRTYDLSSLRLCLSAAEPVPEAIYDRWLAKTGLEIVEGLGSTDVGYIYISNLPGQVRKGSCGRLLDGYEARLVDEEGKDVPEGTIGELWIKSDSTAALYWHHHSKTKSTFLGEWLRTGDMCHRDPDGYYYWDGRADDMLKAGGIWVSPLEVEHALMEHEAVAECAVVGAPDQDGLSKPKAFVKLQPGYNPSPELARELQLFVKGKLAPYKYPRWIEFVEDLPKTFKGTVQRYKLREPKGA